jgi:hypothetical protein
MFFLRKSKADMSSLFAAADDFTELINKASEFNETGVGGALLNKDNANPKQLKWEMSRDSFTHDKIRDKRRAKKGGDRKQKMRGGGGGKMKSANKKKKSVKRKH